MSTSSKMLIARQFYDAGHALFQENRYDQALFELHKAEDAFRKLDARGHPFGNPLPNGVSGLANTLALTGLCCQNLGDYEKAAAYYESSVINAKFEKAKPFQAFLTNLNENLITCYEKRLEQMDPETINSVMKQAPHIDASFRFPFSLSKDIIFLARLYELAPERYNRFRAFYSRAKAKDTEIRHKDKKSDESTMRRMGIYVWGALLFIFSLYGLVVLQALIHNK